MKYIQCAICSTKDNYKVLYKENFELQKLDEKIFSARRTPDKLHYQLVKCKKCGLIFSNPILEESEIENLYEKSKLTYEKEMENLRKTYKEYLSKLIPLKGGKLLEIGCGNGFFLEEAKKMGFEVYGVEPSKDAFNKARFDIKKKITVDFFKKGLYHDNFFDVICFFQTLDHVVNPNEFLGACYKTLKKNGYVLCITHDTGATSSRILGERSPIYDIEHVYLFDKETIKKFFEKNKFKVIRVFDVTNRCSLNYLVKMFPFPQLIKKLLERVFSLTMLNKVNINLGLGNVGILAKKG